MREKNFGYFLMSGDKSMKKDLTDKEVTAGVGKRLHKPME